MYLVHQPAPTAAAAGALPLGCAILFIVFGIKFAHLIGIQLAHTLLHKKPNNVVFFPPFQIPDFCLHNLAFQENLQFVVGQITFSHAFILSGRKKCQMLIILIKNTGLELPEPSTGLPNPQLMLERRCFGFNERQIQHKRLDPHFIVKTMNKVDAFGGHFSFVGDKFLVLKHLDANAFWQHINVSILAFLFPEFALNA